eukprot:GILJ01012416.1.p1 GENE.GILJ01012416.1~~GILJ01012416.1.p1  ORF type:complete len:220 (+),score=20.81 GILJ01012416.1:34-693(+)
MNSDIAPTEFSRAAAVIADSFFKDPVYRWLYRTDDNMRRFLPIVFETYLKHTLCFGFQKRTADFGSFMIAVIPNEERALWDDPQWEPFKLVHAKMCEDLAQPDIHDRFCLMEDVFESLKTDVLKDKYGDVFYLTIIASDPAHQGKGYARNLMQLLLQRADAEQKPIYVECTSDLSARFYRKLGFHEISKTHLPGQDGQADVQIVVFWRDPQGPTTLAIQ